MAARTSPNAPRGAATQATPATVSSSSIAQPSWRVVVNAFSSLARVVFRWVRGAVAHALVMSRACCSSGRCATIARPRAVV